jgi:hypothetical protein
VLILRVHPIIQNFLETQVTPSMDPLAQFFEFESEYAHDLHFVPIAMRYRLDKAGLKISLADWLKISVADRFELATYPSDPDASFQAFAELLKAKLQNAFGNEPTALPLVNPEEWSSTLPLPPSIRESCGPDGGYKMEALWGTLTELQRYALFKLSRSRREPEAFPRAWAEFSKNSALD